MAIAALLLAAPGWAQPKRPAIVGVAHVRLKTNDLAEEKKLFGHDFGFESPFLLDNVTYFKVNDHQYVEITPDLKDDSEDRLTNIAFETTNARQLRDYLASQGIKVPDAIGTAADGNLSFRMQDPDGHEIEFVEYVAGSRQSAAFGKFLPATRISERIIHAGFLVQDRAAEDRLYKDVLGFKETWHGGITDDRADWIDMRVPDGTDWLEYMCNNRNPSVRTRGIMNHLALGVPSAEKGYQTLAERGARMNEKPKIGRDGKWQLNLYDVNLTRVELMEPKPVQPPCCSPFINQ
jgi:catechol 2,3-dioxygenase-like lactoylglutathione lyase family enzyme